MYVERLRLTDFRNYAALDLPLPRGLVVFTGRNAQGKSNLLEAVMLAATSRSFRTTSEREAVRWGAPGRFARVDTTVARRTGPLRPTPTPAPKIWKRPSAPWRCCKSSIRRASAPAICASACCCSSCPACTVTSSSAR